MCTNFLGLADDGKYNKTRFHRLIPTFMIQGGKSHDDTDEKSLWGHSFPDEFDDRLTHSSEGIVSMANSGPGTNRRQFVGKGISQKRFFICIIMTLATLNHDCRNQSMKSSIVIFSIVCQAQEVSAHSRSDITMQFNSNISQCCMESTISFRFAVIHVVELCM